MWIANYAHRRCITFDNTAPVVSLGSGNEFVVVPHAYDVKVSPWRLENQEDGYKDWSRHQSCHLFPAEGLQPHPRYLLYAEFSHHKVANVSDDVRDIHRSLVPATCGVVTFSWRWLMPRTTSLSREVEELHPSAPGMGMCWHLWFVVVSFATHVASSRIL